MAPKTKKTTNAGNSPRGKTLRLTHERSVAILKALADSRRYELLERIANARGPMSCSQVLEAIPIAPATLSHHIKELETAGIIETRREGKFPFISLRPGVLESLASAHSALDRKSSPKG